jgi:hypothetical protein
MLLSRDMVKIKHTRETFLLLHPLYHQYIINKYLSEFFLLKDVHQNGLNMTVFESTVFARKFIILGFS